MISGALKAISNLFKIEQKIKIKKNDVYLVSFPKSGNTWMRFLLINYFFVSKEEKIVYDDLEKYIPSIHKSSVKHINNLKGLRIIKSHFVQKKYPRIIYIVRDGRDALVSYYYYAKQLRGFKGSFKEFYSSKLSSEVGSWDEHVKKALKFKIDNSDNIIFIRYEDMKLSPHKVLADVVEFLGYDVNVDKLDFAVKRSDFNQLKSMQEKNGVTIDNKEIDFFRKGSTNQWKEYFDTELHSLFLEQSKQMIDKFGYNSRLNN